MDLIGHVYRWFTCIRECAIESNRIEPNRIEFNSELALPTIQVI